MIIVWMMMGFMRVKMIICMLICTYVPVYSVLLVQSSMSMLGRPVDIEICVD